MKKHQWGVEIEIQRSLFTGGRGSTRGLFLMWARTHQCTIYLLVTRVLRGLKRVVGWAEPVRDMIL